MSRLHTRRSLDARWPWHQRSAAIGHMNAVVEVFRRVGDVNDYGFDPVTGNLTAPGGTEWPTMLLLYRGQARMVANKDWRARVRTSRGDSGTLHAMRIQIPERDCPPVHAHDIIRAVSAPANMEITHYIFHVRNPLNSSNAWLRNVLCDVDVAHPQVLPPPNTGTPVAPEDIPEPVMECASCGG